LYVLYAARLAGSSGSDATVVDELATTKTTTSLFDVPDETRHNVTACKVDDNANLNVIVDAVNTQTL